MMHVINTGHLPARERFDFWWDVVTSSVVAVDLHSDGAENFRAQMRVTDLGSVRLSEIWSPQFHAKRTPRLIRQSEAEVVQVSMPFSGEAGLRQGAREAVLKPHDVIVYDTSRPFDAWSVRDGHGMILQVHRDLLPVPTAVLERHAALPISGRRGLGAMLIGMLQRTAEETSHLRVAEMTRLGTVILDLVAALLIGESEAQAPDEIHQRRYCCVSTHSSRTSSPTDRWAPAQSRQHTTSLSDHCTSCSKEPVTPSPA